MLVAVFHTPIESPADKAVLLAMAEHAYEDGTNCRPSVGRLAAFAGLDERTVRRVLRRLERDGWIRRTGAPGRYKATEYALSIERLQGGHSAPHGRRRMGGTAPPHGGQRVPFMGGTAPPEPTPEPTPEPGTVLPFERADPTLVRSLVADVTRRLSATTSRRP